MALTKLPKNAIADGAIDDSKIEDGTIQNQEIQGSLTNEKFAGSIANDRLANSSITVAGTSISLGSSTTIPTDTNWQALTVADGSTQVIAEAGKGYFLDTNAGVIEVFLPSSPTRGDTVVLADYAGTFGTNQLIINTGGVNIDSTVGSEFKITTNNAIVECVYVDSAKGWLVYLNQAAGTTPDSILTAYGYDVQNTYITATGGTITTSGDYKIHTFTGDGCFVVSAGGGPRAIVDYLVVAGGASGGGASAAPSGGQGSGGGGGGGFREAKTGNNGCYTASPLANPTGLQLTATTYPITVGSGGAGGNGKGTDGSTSIFSTITSAGGGGGGATCGPYCATPTNGFGNSGGSGGGSSFGGCGGGGIAKPGGSGNTPPVSPPQGNPGGDYNAPVCSPSGGGGAGTAGSNGSPSCYVGGNGGNGVGTGINPSPCIGTPGPCGSIRYYSGGGGGGSAFGFGNGGYGGGTPGSTNADTSSSPANSGGGSGGADAYGPSPVKQSGNGGKGIVIIRYKFQ